MYLQWTPAIEEKPVFSLFPTLNKASIAGHCIQYIVLSAFVPEVACILLNLFSNVKER